MSQASDTPTGRRRMMIRLRGLRFEFRDESQIAPESLVLIDTYKALGLGLSIADNIRGADFQARPRAP